MFSFTKLSLVSDVYSVTDSVYSHAPSVCLPYISDQASAEEKEIHSFLDNANIY